VAIGDGSITSPFLALFGRSARATGMENERNNNPTSAQWLYLLNSSEVQRKLEQGTNLQAIIGFGGKPAPQIVEGLYLTILSRFPTPDEVKTIEAYGRPANVKPASTPKSGRAGQPDAATNLVSVALAQGTNLASTARSTPAKPTNKPIAAKRRDDWFDVAWSLINSEEFLYRH
jgi:hypothetical protein